jgi:transcriptional regulator NrdR family protein
MLQRYLWLRRQYPLRRKKLLCPTCKSDAPVIDSRPQGEYRRRRYKCACGERFTTLEVVLGVGKDMKGLGGRGKKITKVDRWKREIEAKAMKQAKAEVSEQLRQYLLGDRPCQ